MDSGENTQQGHDVGAWIRSLRDQGVDFFQVLKAGGVIPHEQGSGETEDRSVALLIEWLYAEAVAYGHDHAARMDAVLKNARTLTENGFLHLIEPAVTGALGLLRTR